MAEVETETEKVRLAKEVARKSVPTSHRLSRKSDEREGKTGRRSSNLSWSSRRDKIAPGESLPSDMVTRKDRTTDAVEESRRRRSNSRRNLKVDTKVGLDDDDPPTPLTAASTPSPANGYREQSDMRSPGVRKSPSANGAYDDAPIPDLITQTDRFGHAITPRSSKAIESARVEHPTGAKPHLHVDKNGHLTEQDDEKSVDACAETMMDTFRIMCCCFLPESSSSKSIAKKQINTENVTVSVEKPRLLPNPHPDDRGKKCLVLDLDETLVHSSFRAVPGADFVIPVQIEDVVHFVYVLKRPGVDQFLVEMAKYYEIVLYTASLNKYADPLLDLLDTQKVIRTRLFRESCVFYEGNYVKDLSLLDREISQLIIVDNSPSSYIFHPENAIDCTSYIDDPSDRELDQIGSFLKGVKDAKDVRNLCHHWRAWPHVNMEGQ